MRIYLHCIRDETWQNKFISLRHVATRRCINEMAARARIPSNVMKLLSFSSGKCSRNDLAVSFTFGIDIHDREIITLLIVQVWLHGDYIQNFLSWPIFKSPKWRGVSWSFSIFFASCRRIFLIAEIIFYFLYNKNHVFI